MTIQLEKNILRMLEICQVTQIPEISRWNAIGITQEEANIIAYRNKLTLKVRKSSFVPDLRIFEFERSSSNVSKGSFNETMQKGGERSEKTKD